MALSTIDFRTEFKQLAKLAIPILIAQMALAGLGVVDTLMSGQVGTDDLAAIGLGSSIMLPVMMLSTGILIALTPLIAKQFGQQNNKGITQFLYQGIWMSLPLGVLAWILLVKADVILDLLSLTSSVYRLTDDYLFYIAFGLPALGTYFAFRFFWEGLGMTIPTMVISVGALVLNVPLNAVFIYGYGPVEAYGAAGCGIASAIVMWIMLMVAIVFVLKSAKTRHLVNLHYKRCCRPSWQNGFKEILYLGVPNTFALLFETSLFSLVALFVAKLGTTVIAAHQVAISYTSLMFMIPLSMALATTVRVGQAYGEGSRQKLIASTYGGLIIATTLGLVVALITYFLKVPIAGLFTDDSAVAELAILLLSIAAFYQLFDAIQVSTAGALRGLHNTKVTMWVTLFSYWGIGLGGGWLLAYSDWLIEPMGVAGFWVAIVIGFVVAALALQIKLKHLLNEITLNGEVK